MLLPLYREFTVLTAIPPNSMKTAVFIPCIHENKSQFRKKIIEFREKIQGFRRTKSHFFSSKPEFRKKIIEYISTKLHFR